MSNEINNSTQKEVFICYRGEEDKLVFAAGFQLYYLLKEKGVSAFFAPVTLAGSRNFYEKIPSYFETVKIMVVFLTPDFFKEHKANGEDVVFEELRVAFSKPRLNFIPIIFSGFKGAAEYDSGKDYFDSDNLGRIKHHGASTYTGPYSNILDTVAEEIKRSLTEGFEAVIKENLGRLSKNEVSREFDVGITRLAERYCGDAGIDEELISIIENDPDERIRYYAYYCLSIMYRHLKQYENLGRLIDKYHDIFEHHPSAGHLLGLYYLETGEEGDYHELIEATYRNRVRYNRNAGYVHLFADIIVTLFESSKKIADKDAFCKIWYKKALDAVDRAIELDPKYAKYNCTKGRILAMKKDYVEAEKYINRAIALENTKKNDYVLRVSNYYHHKAMVKADQRFSELIKSEESDNV